jgi:hypothetical protein
MSRKRHLSDFRNRLVNAHVFTAVVVSRVEPQKEWRVSLNRFDRSFRLLAALSKNLCRIHNLQHQHPEPIPPAELLAPLQQFVDREKALFAQPSSWLLHAISRGHIAGAAAPSDLVYQ